MLYCWHMTILPRSWRVQATGRVPNFDSSLGKTSLSTQSLPSPCLWGRETPASQRWLLCLYFGLPVTGQPVRHLLSLASLIFFLFHWLLCYWWQTCSCLANPNPADYQVLLHSWQTFSRILLSSDKIQTSYGAKIMPYMGTAPYGFENTNCYPMVPSYAVAAW